MENINKDDVRIGRSALIQAIGEDYCRQHEDTAVFSYGMEDAGLFCFLGISFDTSAEIRGLSASFDDWDIYASCYVNDGVVTMYKCRLPETDG